MTTLHARPRTRQELGAMATEAHVSTIMTKDVITVRSGTSLGGVAELMLSRGLSRVPVVNERGELIGVVSKTDLVDQAQVAGDVTETRSEHDEAGEGFHIVRQEPVVDDVMSRSVVGVGDDASIDRAARLMIGQRVHGLPVVARNGELLGWISTMDILGWLTAPHD